MLFLLIVPDIPILNCPPTSHKSPNPPGRTSALCPPDYSTDLNALLAFPLTLPPSTPPGASVGLGSYLVLWRYAKCCASLPICLACFLSLPVPLGFQFQTWYPSGVTLSSGAKRVCIPNGAQVWLSLLALHPHSAWEQQTAGCGRFVQCC